MFLSLTPGESVSTFPLLSNAEFDSEHVTVDMTVGEHTHGELLPLS
jgi:hypothetical protein